MPQYLHERGVMAQCVTVAPRGPTIVYMIASTSIIDIRPSFPTQDIFFCCERTTPTAMLPRPIISVKFTMLLLVSSEDDLKQKCGYKQVYYRAENMNRS